MSGVHSCSQSVEAGKLFGSVNIEAEIVDQNAEDIEATFLGRQNERRLEERLGRVELGQNGRTDHFAGLDLLRHAAVDRLQQGTDKGITSRTTTIEKLNQTL